MELSVKDKKTKEKLFQIVDFHLEALRLAGNMSAKQQRFIEVAVTCGPALEPSGVLAGRRS
jgi:ABC-type branched-subunit amino acid transport system ATPase component